MRRIVLSTLAALVVVLAGPSLFSQDGDGNTYHQEILNNYYSDDSYETAVGWDDRDCSGYLDSGGSATDWRFHEIYSCDGVPMWSGCQEYHSGTGWVNVQCPDTNVTAEARVRIPVG